MKIKKILNLYAGLGGNRKKWDKKHTGQEYKITNVEKDPKIAKVLKEMYPNDEVVVADAHQYLLDHHDEFDLIWASRPCQSHTKFIRSGRNRKPIAPDMVLYSEILFLKYNFKGLWVVENVKPYYEPFMNPVEIGRHLFWSNFKINKIEHKNIPGFIMKCNTEGANKLKDWLGIHYEGNIYYNGNHDPAQVLRNCVHPDIGLSILKDAILGESAQ